MSGSEERHHVLSFLYGVRLRDCRPWVAYRTNHGTSSDGYVGSFLVILWPLTTLLPRETRRRGLSGKATTVHGCPFLALQGFLVIKDSIMLAQAILTMR